MNIPPRPTLLVALAALPLLVAAGCVTGRVAVAPTLTHRGEPGLDAKLALGLAPRPLDDEHALFLVADFGLALLPGGDPALLDMFGVDFVAEDEDGLGPWRVGLRAGGRLRFGADDAGLAGFGVRAALLPWSRHTHASCHEKGLDLWCATHHRNLGLELGFDAQFGDERQGRADSFLFLVGVTADWLSLD